MGNSILLLKIKFSRYNIKQLITSCFIIFSCLNVFSQTYNFKHITSEDGLPSSCVYSSIQDKNGFIWFGTDKGLARFDGIHFKEYNLKAAKSVNTVVSFCLDNDSNIIIGSHHGFCKMANSNILMPFNIDSLVLFSNNQIVLNNNFLYSRDNAGYINVVDLSNKYLISDEIFYLSLKKNKALSLYKCRSGLILVGRTDGIYTFSQKNQQIKLNVPCINNKNIFSITEDDDGAVWLGTTGMIYKMKNLEIVDSISINESKSNELYCLAANSKSGIWIYDNKFNIFHYKYSNGDYTYYNVSNTFGLEKGTINHINLDSDNNVWISTYNDGVYFFSKTYIINYGSNITKSSFGVNDVYINENKKILLATKDGTVCFDGYNFTNDTSTNYYAYHFLKFRAKPVIVTNGIIYNSETLYNTKISGLKALCARRAIAFNDSVIIRNRWTNKLEILTYHNEKLIKTDLTIIANNLIGRVMSIYKVADSSVFVSAADKLYLINVFSGISKEISFVKSTVFDIRGHRNCFYFASDDGLYTYDLIKNKWTFINKLGDLELKNLSTIEFDKLDRLWIGSNEGVLIWKNDFYKKIYGKSYLPSNEINCLKYDSTDNKMYIGTVKGLSTVNVNEMDLYSGNIHNIHIDFVKVKDSLYYDFENRKLDYNQTDISVYFSTPEFVNSNEISYSYKFDESQWIYTNENVINLIDLSYGKHQVKIRSSIDKINWSNEKVLSFFIAFPFYRTYTFYIIAITLFSVLFYFMYSLRIKAVRAKAQKEINFAKQLEDLRYQALNAAVNPHFIFNCLGSIQSYITNNKPFEASDYIARFARLIRLTLNQAGKKQILLKDEIDRLELYLELEKLRNANKLITKLIIDNGVDFNVLIPNMVIQPLIENSIIHGIQKLPNNVLGRIEIRITQSDDIIKIIVDDNGIGYDENSKSAHGYKSIGLSNVIQRLEIIEGATFSIKNKKTVDPSLHGTIATITLKI